MKIIFARMFIKNLFYQTKIIDVHMNFALEWQLLMGVNTLIWAPNEKKNKTISQL